MFFIVLVGEPDSALGPLSMVLTLETNWRIGLAFL